MSTIVFAFLLRLCLPGALAADPVAPSTAATTPASTASTPAVAPTPGISPASAASIRKLLKATGAGDVAVQSLKTMVAQLKLVRPDIPAEFWTQFAAEVDANGLVEMLVPVYARHFDEKEIRALTKFYESPVGKRFVTETPALMQEATVVGQQWGQQVAQKVVQNMLNAAPAVQGPPVPPAVPDAPVSPATPLPK